MPDFHFFAARKHVERLSKEHPIDYETEELADDIFMQNLEGERNPTVHPRIAARRQEVEDEQKERRAFWKFVGGMSAVVAVTILTHSCEKDNANDQLPPTPTTSCVFSENRSYEIKTGQGTEDLVYEISGIDSANNPCFDEAEARVFEAIENVHDYDQIWPGDTIYIPRSVEVSTPNAD